MSWLGITVVFGAVGAVGAVGRLKSALQSALQSALRSALRSALQSALQSARQAGAVMLALAIGGCTALPRSAPPDDAVQVEPAGVSIYLTDLLELSNGDPVVAAEIHERARNAFEDAATTTNRLRLALVLGQPGHPASDPGEAQSMLNELLATPESLLPDERALAAIHLQEIEERLILEAENRRLQARIAAAVVTNRQDAESEQRLRDALEENRRLSEALDEAESKLEAVTSIERSIRERGENGEVP